jgi:hypothetical protein
MKSLITSGLVALAAAAAVSMAPGASASTLHTVSCEAQKGSEQQSGLRHDRDKLRHERHEAEGHSHRAVHSVGKKGSHHKRAPKTEDARFVHDPHRHLRDGDRDLRDGRDLDRDLHRNHGHRAQQCGNTEGSGWFAPAGLRHDTHRAEGKGRHERHRLEGRGRHELHEIEHHI